MMNWKVLEESGRGLILRYYPGIRLEGLRETTDTLFMIAGLRVEILTKNLSNTNRGC
jgi:hypothetical protein